MKRIALVGSPNSGKSTLFNWLTGRRQKVVNYPGSTVDIAVGKVLPNLASDLEFIDTPGTYSLYPKSQDEEVTRKTLFDEQFGVEGVIAVLDSTQMARQIPLLLQLKESGFPIVVALTMHDLHRKEKSPVQHEILARELGLKVCPIDGVLGGGVKDLVTAAQGLAIGQKKPQSPLLRSKDQLLKEQNQGERLAIQVAKHRLSAHDVTERADRLLLHPFLGGLVFFGVMGFLFSSIYWLAAPLMDLVDGGFSGLAEWVTGVFGDSLAARFLSDGVIVGLGSVFVFVPQILILFLGISALEDSGYLARAATIVDKPLSKIGLNGKAFVPLLSGFACAVPAMMAARSMNSQKEKWLTMMVIPLMTCSARLPVYALLISFLFANDPLKGGFLMAALYLAGIFFAVLVAGVLGRFVKFENRGFFVMELPLYRLPRPSGVFKNSLQRTRAYIVKTGPVILVLSIVMWVVSTFPNYDQPDSHSRIETSYVASFGRTIEPVFEPMGVDWRVGVGLLTAFAAREVFVSSLAVVMNVVETDDEETLRQGLLEKMQDAKFLDGRPVFTAASVAAILMFFVIALQCISTSSVAWREMGSAQFAIFQLVLFNVLAYVIAVITYQVLS